MILGSSMAEMMRTFPWHLLQVETSILTTRFKSLAQDIRLALALGFSDWISWPTFAGSITNSSGSTRG